MGILIQDKDFRIQDRDLRIQGLGIWIQDKDFRIQGLGIWILDKDFRIRMEEMEILDSGNGKSGFKDWEIWIGIQGWMTWTPGFSEGLL